MLSQIPQIEQFRDSSIYFLQRKKRQGETLSLFLAVMKK